MAFASVLLHKAIIGDLIMAVGTYTSTEDSTGGDINTQTDRCLFLKLQKTGSGAGTNTGSVNETMPCPGGAVTVITDANEAGIWIALGEGVGY